MRSGNNGPGKLLFQFFVSNRHPCFGEESAHPVIALDTTIDKFSDMIHQCLAFVIHKQSDDMDFLIAAAVRKCIACGKFNPGNQLQRKVIFFDIR